MVKARLLKTVTCRMINHFKKNVVKQQVNTSDQRNTEGSVWFMISSIKPWHKLSLL